MNERIKKLAEQADAYADAMDIGGKNYIGLRDNYFAELIVKQCCNVVDAQNYYVYSGDVKKLILERFGIEA